MTIQTSMLYQVVYNSKSYFLVYIIILCPEIASNDTVTGPNWNPGTDKKNTYRTPARIPVFEWVLFQEHTFTDKRQNTRNRRQIRFLPLFIGTMKALCSSGKVCVHRPIVSSRPGEIMFFGWHFGWTTVNLKGRLILSKIYMLHVTYIFLTKSIVDTYIFFSFWSSCDAEWPLCVAGAPETEKYVCIDDWFCQKYICNM